MVILQKIRSKVRLSVIVFAAAVIGATMVLSAEQSYAATPTTQQIADTIKAKCRVAVSKDAKRQFGQEERFKALVQACEGTGIYKEKATRKAQRAKRLLDMCVGFSYYLHAQDAFSTRGPVDGGDCVKIRDNVDLERLTENLRNYPANSLGFYEDPALDCSSNPNATKCDLMKKYINPFIEFLAVFVGVAVTIGIITGGIRYASAGDDPQKVTSAKNMIRNAIIVLISFIFLYAAIQWMIPQTG